MKELNAFIYLKDNVNILSLNVDYLKELPLKVAMTALYMIDGYCPQYYGYFSFEEKVKDFMRENEQEYKKLKEQETDRFQEWGDLFFNYYTNNIPDEVFSLVSKVYEKEQVFTDMDEMPKFPTPIYKTTNFNLDVKNIDELNNILGKGVMLESACLFVANLNREFTEKHKDRIKRTPFTTSDELRKSLFDNNINNFVFLERFEGADYQLSQMHLNIMESSFTKYKNVFEEIIKSVYVMNQVVQGSKNQLNDKNKKKLKM